MERVLYRENIRAGYARVLVSWELDCRQLVSSAVDLHRVAFRQVSGIYWKPQKRRFQEGGVSVSGSGSVSALSQDTTARRASSVEI